MGKSYYKSDFTCNRFLIDLRIRAAAFGGGMTKEEQNEDFMRL